MSSPLKRLEKPPQGQVPSPAVLRVQTDVLVEQWLQPLGSQAKPTELAKRVARGRGLALVRLGSSEQLLSERPKAV